ncbi:MAG: hypothetical protein J7494_10860 [Sphingobium sp.]|nr:hypothetical protein [Sphingobium sp.]
MTTVTATLNYFDPALERGRFDLVEPERNLMPFEAHEVDIRDMRGAGLSIEREGFVLASHSSEVARLPEMLDTNLVAQDGLPPVNRAYYEELQPLIEKISGAREVIPQATGLTVRFSNRSQRQSWAGAAGFIHVDVTDQSIGRFLDFSLAALGREIAPFSRFVLYQTWRTVSDPPQDNLLTLCDRSSVRPSDVAYYDAVLTGKGSMMESVEAASCRYNPGHRWYYASDMGAEDVIVFLGHDSAQPHLIQPFHTGFDVPGSEGAIPRASLEARFFAFYD